MSLTLISGTVSHLEQTTMTSGRVRHGHGNVSTTVVTNFRIDNRPVKTQVAEGGISNGDLVTAVGEEKKGTFHAVGVRNETTGAVQETSSVPMYVLAVFCLLIGVPLWFLSALLGLPAVLLAGVCIYAGRRIGQAKSRLAATPILTAARAAS